ncbi:MAG TPA: response regulator [Candidatus Parcubacteria bacterium]|nr:response regulator [Candidatus Parcubacteria bacterium]
MKTILLVEDDPFLIDIYTTKLKETGFNVEVATDGYACLSKIKEKNEKGEQGKVWPDLVLLDIVLPQIDGWEVLSALRKDEKLKNIKVIVLSNLGQREEVEKGNSFKVVKYLIKAHFTPSEVVEEIKKVI